MAIYAELMYAYYQFRYQLLAHFAYIKHKSDIDQICFIIFFRMGCMSANPLKNVFCKNRFSLKTGFLKVGINYIVFIIVLLP